MGLDKSKSRQKSDRRKKNREEKRWARKSGTVTVRFDPSVIRKKEDPPAA